MGLDFRPPLYSAAGIARYAGELAAALGAGQPGIELVLYADAFRAAQDPARVADLVRQSRGRLLRRRVPARVAHALGRLGIGIEVRTGPLDLFHYTDLVYPPLTRTPYVVTLHDVVFEIEPRFHGEGFHRAVPRRVRRALQGAKAVLVPSEETRRRVIERELAPAERVRCIPLGGDHVLRGSAAGEGYARTLLARHGVADPFVLCVGTIEPRKNHGRVLQAFERFAAGRPHALVLVGSFGWLCDDVRRMLAAASARVVHLEGVPDDALAALYRTAQFTVYASLYEGFGLPVLESMTQGVPVLTTRGGALPEVGGDAVLYAAAEDVADLARAMERLAEDADLRRDLALRGRQRAGRFTWRATAAATADVYRDVVQRGT